MWILVSIKKEFCILSLTYICIFFRPYTVNHILTVLLYSITPWPSSPTFINKIINCKKTSLSLCLLCPKAMSDPPTTLIPLKPHIATTTTITTAAATSSPLIRDYRKGNWTIQETLILITAKKLDEERRVKAASSTPPPDPTTPTTKPPCKPGGELRWKWVENYCWNHGCLRSQNQCNDKWDNLLRDYKKVREYESKSNASKEFPSYWNIEKQDRKDRNLPSNMAFEVFQALNQVLQRRYSQTSASPTAKPVLSFAPSPTPVTVVPPNLPPAPAPMRPPEISGTAAIPLVKELFNLVAKILLIYLFI